MILSLSSCDAPGKPIDTTDESETTTVADKEDTTTAEEEHPYTEHQELKKTEIERVNGMMAFSIPEAGLENVFVEDISDTCYLEGDTVGTVYLLGDDRYGGGGIPADHYFAIVTGEKIILKDLTAYDVQACYFGHVQVGDVDGDRDCEIILQQNVGITGGAGSYISRVFDFKDGEIVEMYSSYDGEVFIKDTGFSIKLLNDKKYEISNSITGYSEIFQSVSEDESYYDFWYDENGDPRNRSIMVDSFSEFTVCDTDGNGVNEIVCTQVVSLISHTNVIGHAKTILKYNTEKSELEIVDARFEPTK